MTSCIILAVTQSIVFVYKKCNTVSIWTSCIVTLLIQLVDMLTVLFRRNLSQTQSQSQSELFEIHMERRCAQGHDNLFIKCITYVQTTLFNFINFSIG